MTINRLNPHRPWGYLLVILLATSAAASSVRADGGDLYLLSSRREVIAFALNRICLPLLRQGGHVTDLAGASGHEEMVNGVAAFRLNGLGRVFVDQNANGACEIRGTMGDGARLRDDVLGDLDQQGAVLESVGDQSGFQGRDWFYRHETYCLRVDDRAMVLRLYSSRNDHMQPLYAGLAWDGEGGSKSQCPGAEAQK